jgi:hypothetical protein
MPPLARLLVVAGLVAVAAGLLLWLVPGAGMLGRLPGDLRFERGGARVYVPITTSILISVALTLVLWLVSRLR